MSWMRRLFLSQLRQVAIYPVIDRMQRFKSPWLGVAVFWIAIIVFFFIYL